MRKLDPHTLLSALWLFTAGPALMAPPTDMDDVLHFGDAFCAVAAISWIAWRWRAGLSEPAHR